MPKRKHYRSDNLNLPLELTRDEVVSAVAKYHCAGYPPSEIIKFVNAEYGVELSREDPARLLSYAGQLGRLQYIPPIESDLQNKLSQRYPWLGDHLEVVHTMVSEDVAHRGAKLLVEMMQNFERSNRSQRAYHIGFAGGHLLRKLARSLAHMLRHAPSLPRKLVFHSTVASFDLVNPITAPNSFFSFFGDEMALPVEVEFVVLNAPGIVKSEAMEMLQNIGMVRRAMDRAGEIDVIFAGAGHWENGHSVLHKMYAQEAPDCLEQLKQLGCIGDMMWQPIGKDGPLKQEVESRVMTVMDLGELPAFIDNGKSMVLLVGPCGVCRRPKDEVLEPILAAKPRLLTHLVIDSLTASRLVQ